MIPMSGPDLGDAELQAVLGVLRTPLLSNGPMITAFENAVAQRVGSRHAIGVSSGTAGLHLAVIAAGISQGDLVLTTPFSFVASANCVLYEQGIPVFVDVDPRTGNIDPVAVAEAATALCSRTRERMKVLPPSIRSRTQVGPLKAILPVHAFGQPCDMDPILEAAQKHGLLVIEDACEAIGAEYKGRPAGSLGDAAVFAFYPNKQMTTGEGGIILTQNQEWQALFRSLRNQGRDVFDAWLHHSRLGYNYRMDEMSAALGLAQFRRLEELLANRQRTANWYLERLRGCEGIETPLVAPSTSRMSWFVFVVRIRPPAKRDAVVRSLEEHSIPSRPYFTPIHLQPYFAKLFGYRLGDFPVAESLGRECLALPFSGVMTENQVDCVCEEMVRAVRESASRTC